MVGIPGKSKGCNTCRRRKKGCDLQRPVCSECQRLNLRCDGYTRDTVWVNLTQETGTARRRRTREQRTEVTLAETFTRSAYHEKYLGIFWSSYLPHGRAFPPSASQYATGTWMNELHRLYRMENQLALKKVLLAIAITSVGKQDNKSWMVEKGIDLYGSALATLASQIGSRDDTIGENSLIASTLLSLYEIFYGYNHHDRLQQVKNWSLHLMGEIGFLTARGPEAFTTGLAHQLFVDGRSTLVHIEFALMSLSDGSKEWKTIPWTYHPKTAKDLLGDIFAEIPGMLGEIDVMRITRQPDTKETLRQKISTQVFDHLIAAQAMVGYYALGVFLCSILHIASGEPSSMRLSHNTVPRTLCRKMLEIIPTFLDPYVGDFGVHGAIFPSIVIISYFDEVDDGIPAVETDALYKLFAQDKNGKTIRYFVYNMLRRFQAGGVKMFI